MSINPTEIRLSPKLQAAIAHYAELEGKPWEEVLEDRFPTLEDPTSEELVESLTMCDRGMADAKAGRGTDAKEALARIADGLGLKLPQ
jgi:predicted transcriptional regulator